MIYLAVPWALITLGLTYMAREAKILSVPRAWLIFKRPFLATLLGCGECTSFWTGTAAAAILLPVLDDVAWQAWCYLPAAGLAGTGLFNLLSRLSPVAAVGKIVKVLERQSGECDGQ